MKHLRSSIYLPNEIQLAHELATALEDQKSLSFYLLCVKKYPKDYLLSTLNHVCAIPEHSIRTTRARLFTNIVINSIFNTDDDIRD